METTVEIKDVAIYLRKSRGEEEDLAKHRTELEELCKNRGWRSVEYSEIGSSDSIDLRPKMLQLLKDVEDDLYDGVVVMDMDRLSRGDGEQQARIMNILRRSQTLIVTPNKIYDLENDTDIMVSEFEGFIARQEYRQIKKRLKRGKRQGARRGDWTNGTPPYPYEYQEWFDEKNKEMYRNEKGLVVNKEKLVIYRYILDKILRERVTPHHVAWELNKQRIASPRSGVCSGRWHCETIRRLMLNTVHLGNIISNKSSGDGHKVKTKDSKAVVYNPEDEWVVVANCHEAVKTQDEHDKLVLFLGKRLTGTKRRGAKVYTLSGLLKCARCGRTMVAEFTKGNERIRGCWYIDDDGKRCGNGGSVTSHIRTIISEKLAIFEEELKQSLSSNDGDDSGVLKEINLTLTEITKLERKINKVDDLVEDDYYTPTEAKKRKAEHKVLLDQAETKLTLLQLKLDNSQKMSNQERLNIIDQFKEQMLVEDLSPEKINELYKSIISHIVWDRRGSKYLIEVNFL